MDENDGNSRSAARLARASLDAAWTEIGNSREKPTPSEDDRTTFVQRLRGKPHPNFAVAAERLQQAEEAYQKNNFGEALNYTVQGRDAADMARLAESWGTKFWSLAIFMVLILYAGWALNTLLIVAQCSEPSASTETAVAHETPMPTPTDHDCPCCSITAGATVIVNETPVPTLTCEPITQAIRNSVTPAPTSKDELALPNGESGNASPPEPTSNWKPLKFFGIDLHVIRDICIGELNTVENQRGMNIPVFFWGFLGGVVWGMYGLYRWYSQRLFDKHYVYWYALSPWVAAILGGMFVLTLVSGLVNTEVSNLTNPTDNWALLYLTSFVVGLATHDFLKLLVRIVSALFGQVATAEK